MLGITIITTEGLQGISAIISVTNYTTLPLEIQFNDFSLELDWVFSLSEEACLESGSKCGCSTEHRTHNNNSVLGISGWVSLKMKRDRPLI